MALSPLQVYRLLQNRIFHIGGCSSGSLTLDRRTYSPCNTVSGHVSLEPSRGPSSDGLDPQLSTANTREACWGGSCPVDRVWKAGLLEPSLGPYVESIPSKQSVFVGVYIRRQQKRRTQESVDVIGITIVECSATKSSDKGRAICQVLMCIGVKPADDGVRAERQDNYINGLRFIGGRCDLYLWRCHDSPNSNWVYR